MSRRGDGFGNEKPYAHSSVLAAHARLATMQSLGIFPRLIRRSARDLLVTDLSSDTLTEQLRRIPNARRRGSPSGRYPVCRMFSRAIARQSLPRHVSSDHDPLFRFHRWRADLGVLEVAEIKTIPGTPPSHSFVVRLIRTIRREYLDRSWFWRQSDLQRKLDDYQAYYNQYRCQTGLGGVTPARRGGAPAPRLHTIDSYRWRPHCDVSFRTPTAA